MMIPDPDVLGYISQCGICPQKVIIRAPRPSSGQFICPRCREVTGWGDVDVAQAEPAAALVNATEDGDEPIGEAPELTMPRVASALDRQTAALNEIRALASAWADPGAGDAILAVLDRLGV